MGTGHSHGPASTSVSDGLYLPGRTLLHRLPAEVKLVGLVAFVVTVVATPREQAWAFGVYALLLLDPARGHRGARAHGAAPHGHRGAVPRLRRPAALRRPRGAGGRARAVAVRRRPARRVQHPRQGHPRRRRGDPAVGHDHAARPGRRPAAAAGARAVRDDPVVHGPLPRRRGGRHAPDGARPGRPRLRGQAPGPRPRRGQGGRRAVHPLLRAGRARAPGHGQPRLHRHHAAARGARLAAGAVGRPGRRVGPGGLRRGGRARGRRRSTAWLVVAG